MKYKTLAAAIPLVLTLSACTTVEPAFKDIGSRTAPCVDGGPDTVAQTFYDLRIKMAVLACRIAASWRNTALT